MSNAFRANAFPEPPLPPGLLRVDTEDEAARIDEAACYLRAGLWHLKLEDHPRTPKQRRMFALLHDPWRLHLHWPWQPRPQCPNAHVQVNYLLELFFVIVYVVLVLFEKPAVYDMPLFAPALLEVACLLYFGVNLYWRIQVAGGLTVLRSQQNFRLRVVFLFVAALDVILYASSVILARPLRLIRPFFLMDIHYATSTRRVLRQIMQSTLRVLDMIALMMTFVLLWALIAFHLFYDSDPCLKGSVECGFGSLADSFNSLFLALSTTNFPDVEMADFHEHRATALFYIIYVGIGMYFMLNLFLALVYRSFADLEKEKFKAVFLHERAALRSAFQVLASADEGLGPALFIPAVQAVFPLSSRLALLAFAYLDRIGIKPHRDGRVDLEEFYSLFDVLPLHWQLDTRVSFGPDVTNPPLAVPAWRVTLQRWRAAARWLAREPLFELAIQLIICINALVVVIDAARVHNGAPPSLPAVAAFLALFAGEAALKIFAFGWRHYTTQRWNRFDFAIVCISFGGFLLETMLQNEAAVRLGVVLRTLRLLRVFRVRAAFRRVVTTMGFLFQQLGRYVAVLFCVNYIFAVIGMSLFADTVSHCTPDICGVSFKLVEWNEDCNVTFFQLNNFDDVLYSYNTLFDLTVVNDFHLIMAGHVAMTSRWARLFFYAYYLLVVLVVTNVIVAFILDGFIALTPVFEDKSEPDPRPWYQVYFPFCCTGKIKLARANSGGKLSFERVVGADSQSTTDLADSHQSASSTLTHSVSNSSSSHTAAGITSYYHTRDVSHRALSLHQRTVELDLALPLTPATLYAAFLGTVARAKFDVTQLQRASENPRSVHVRLPVHLVTAVLAQADEEASRALFQDTVAPIIQAQAHLVSPESAAGQAAATTTQLDKVRVDMITNEDGDRAWRYTLYLPTALALAGFDANNADLRLLRDHEAATGAFPPTIVYTATHTVSKADLNRAHWGADIDRWLMQETVTPVPVRVPPARSPNVIKATTEKRANRTLRAPAADDDLEDSDSQSDTDETFLLTKP